MTLLVIYKHQRHTANTSQQYKLTSNSQQAVSSTTTKKLAETTCGVDIDSLSFPYLSHSHHYLPPLMLPPFTIHSSPLQFGIFLCRPRWSLTANEKLGASEKLLTEPNKKGNHRSWSGPNMPSTQVLQSWTGCIPSWLCPCGKLKLHCSSATHKLQLANLAPPTLHHQLSLTLQRQVIKYKPQNRS